MELECFVRFNSGAYVTSTVNGERASSTMDAAAAAERLGEKLFGPSFVGIVRGLVATRRGILHDTYKLQGDEKRIAYCWMSGLIEFGDQVPVGALAFASGPRRALHAAVAVAARHGKGASEGKLLVPGVPEAATGLERVDALKKWTEWRAKQPVRYGVQFSRDVASRTGSAA